MPRASTEPRRGVYDRKPTSDIYTAMLGISLAAILLAITFLCLEMASYNWEFSASGL